MDFRAAFGRGWLLPVLFAGFSAILSAPAVLADSPSAPPTRHVWVDTDLLVSPAGTIDPDDLVALEMLRRAPGIEIVGLSASAANGPLQRTRESLAVHASWLPTETRIDSSCTMHLPGVAALTVLALGPATNLPRLVGCLASSGLRVDAIVIIGGRLAGEELWLDQRSRRFRPMRDLNYEADRPAFGELLAAGIPTRLVPFAAGNSVRLSFADVAPALGDEEAVLAVRNWIATLALVGGAWRMPAFDPAAAAYLLWPQDFACEPVLVEALGADFVLGSAGMAVTTMGRCMPARPDVTVARIRELLRAARLRQ